MKNKINKRLVGIAIIAIIATLIGTTFIYYELFKKQVESELLTTANLLKNSKTFDIEDKRNLNVDLSTNLSNLRVTWIDKDGKVLYDNDVLADKLPNHLDRPEIKDALKKGSGKYVRKSDTMNKNTFYYAILLDNGKVLRVATDAVSIFYVFKSSAWVISMIVLLIITICIVLSNLLANQLLKPIEMMAENLENEKYKSPYKELEPFAEKLKSQHTDVLSAAKARQDFTANVSHELKTPLTAIVGFTELLENDMVPEGKRQHIYNEIHKNSDRLLALINDIIRLSEVDQKSYEMVFKPTDLYKIARETIDDLQINAEKKEVKLSLTGEEAIINANVNLVSELVENLVQNAIRYNNPGGKVEVLVYKKNDRTILSVEDNGIGIPADEQQRIFERFYRVDKSRSKATGGTGLGLAIVKHIVELHDAKIEVESELGEGTIIRVIF